MYIHFNHNNQLSIKRIWGAPEQNISGIYYDSRKSTPGSVFVCMSGENHDGHMYMKEAIQNGATVIAGDNAERLKEGSQQYPGVTFILTENARSFLAHISIIFHERVHEKIKTVGVTGTNGKTTVAAYVKSLMTNLGMLSGYIGTIGMFTSKGRIEFSQTTPTTPESIDLHSIFNEMYLEGDQLASMEVTSVVIEQKRVEGINFDIAIHTNLTPEHLEFHQTFENYRTAKLKLFHQAKQAVVNIDDEGMSAEILDIFKGPVLTYSLDKNTEADVKANNIKMSATGTVFEMVVDDESYIVRAPIFGNYNVANLLAAVCTALHSGYTVQEILPAITMIESPEGRLEVLQEYGNRNIILDYAHTPPALKNLISEVKKMPHRRLIVMIAGIGIRDWEKMPQMAQAIEGEVDEIVVSVDHPGFHEPEDIINKVLTGFKNPRAGNIHTAPTRHKGVLTALELSREKDLIIFTSGCINGAQLVKGERVPHSDKDIITNYFSSTKEAPSVEYVQG
ncbi:UDP-N-acetylmuramoyl-L-alanyl-D-glutamate--2,6-diaminopimelate ligase [Mesobacillus subterraneus]|uniref:UDP-N-acetylmuramoyl-L-alanyl-D-glutamate--2, 6-diaminopimelate ligase n=1 Tax=Mesobacillus subterraneus TaxID=285983 RepID=UPI00273DEAB0|nr:UDP-N-acetylmuramoyl-L-alanyl-D-glutamate--2,6-diaminopimelate ligase [Mesobacillus subterraneus]WLR54748.1 UDP-N-acetylmuramoyl-L-alanyl-D-glutamate--2,6-diaminopimelate ligase [Mesobacillus subterraneus]